MLREKDLPHEDLLPLAEELAEAAKRHDRQLIVNSSLETAVAVKAWALQLPMDLFLRLRSDSRLADFKVGVSIHSLEEARCRLDSGRPYFRNRLQNGTSRAGPRLHQSLETAPEPPNLGGWRAKSRQHRPSGRGRSPDHLPDVRAPAKSGAGTGDQRQPNRDSRPMIALIKT